MDEPQRARENEFENQAKGEDLGFLQEFFLFLRENKKWWLVPLIVSLLSIGVITLLSGSGGAPFIYTFF